MPAGADPSPVPLPAPRVQAHPGLRLGLFVLGWLSLSIGLAGLLVPLVPTTVLLVLAVWAFSRSSTRVHDWLYHHPRLGPPLRAWQAHGAIPLRAKVLALGMLGAALAAASLLLPGDWPLLGAFGAVLVLCAAYVLSRPHRPI